MLQRSGGGGEGEYGGEGDWGRHLACLGRQHGQDQEACRGGLETEGQVGREHAGEQGAWRVAREDGGCLA